MLHLRMLSLLPLMFMGLLCDAERTCAPEILIMDPPVLVVEHEEKFTLNCSTFLPQTMMYWKISKKPAITDNSYADEDDGAYITLENQSLTWNDTVVCGINLNTSYECVQVADITLYQNPGVSVYEVNMSNVSGEKRYYELQCDIVDVAPIRNLTVTWYKGNKSVKKDSFEQTTRTPVSVSSSLTVPMRKGEPPTEYKCEAQLEFRPNGPTPPAVFATYTLDFTYAPELKGEQTESLNVSKGDTVTLNCEADGNPPPQFHWTCSTVAMTENMGNVTIAEINDPAFCTCTPTNGLGTIVKKFVINIMPPPAVIRQPLYEAPDNTPAPMDCNGVITLTPAEVVVKYGDSVSINCSASDIKGMGWEAEFGGISLQSVPFLTWKVDNLTYWDINPQCFVQRNGSMCVETPVITLYKPPDSVSISMSSYGPMLEGREYTMQCDIVNVAPVQNLKIQWYRGDEIMETQVFNNTLKTPEDVSSTMNVTVNRNDNRKDFRCEAELYLGPNGPDVPVTASEPYNADVHYQPVVQDCPDHYSGLEHVFTIDTLPCRVEGNPLYIVHWYYQGKRINTSKPLTRHQSGEYTVQAENTIGKSNASIYIKIEYGPSFACDNNITVKENDMIQTECEPEGQPKPSLTWFTDGKEMASTHQWTKHDSGYYELRATNKHGDASRRLYVDVLYAPVIMESNYSITVTPGENVTFHCHSKGNPVPRTEWNSASSVVSYQNTGGHYNNISFTVATSTDAVYACNAMNEVGSTSIYVTLTITDIQANEWYESPLVICVAVVIAIIIITAIYFFECSKKKGHYNFIPNGANGDTPVPMNTMPNGVEV